MAKSFRNKNPLSLVVGGLQIGLLILIGWLVTRAILLRTNPESIWTPIPQVTGMTQNADGKADATYEFSSDPFRLAKSEIIESPVFTDPGFDVPETQLNLELTGRTVGNPGSAVLKTPDNKEQSYRVGDEVLNGVILQNVTSEFVVLDVRGELERLTFSKENQTSLGLSEQGNVNAEPSAIRVRSGTTQIDPAPSFSNVDTMSLLNAIRLNPNFEKGELRGYQIQPRGNPDVLKALGLEAGDMVTAVNGESLLQGRLDLQELSQTLGNAREVRLDIIRDGRPQTVKIGS